MASSMLCISHESALFYWRTNPPWYVLEGGDRSMRSLRGSPNGLAAFQDYQLAESEFGPQPIDVLLPAGTTRCPEEFRKHSQRAKLPPHALYPLDGGVHVVSPELCLLQLCQSKSLFEMLEIGMEFCGTYALRPGAGEGETSMAPRVHTLTRANQLRRRFESWRGLHGIELARKMSHYLVDNSASPMETKLYLLLCLPQSLGGYHFSKPELNPEIPLGPDGQEILRQAKVKPDMLWRQKGLVVEYDGEYHNDPNQALKDEMRRAVMTSMGLTVRIVKKQQLYNPLAFDSTTKAIAKLLGKRLRPLTPQQRHAREELREELLGKRGEYCSLMWS